MQYLIVLSYMTVLTLCLIIPKSVKQSSDVLPVMGNAINKIMYAVALWVLTVLLQLVLPSGAWTVFLHEFKYVFILATMLFGCDFIFSITHVSSNIRKLSWYVQLTMIGIIMLLIATNGYHHWFRQTLEPLNYHGLNLLISHNGPLYLWVAKYMYSLFGFYLLVLLFMILNVSKVYRKQYVILFIATSVPIGTSILFQYGFFPRLLLDPAPFSFFVTALMYLYMIRNSDVLIIHPLKHIRVIGYISHPVVLINRFGKIVDANDYCKNLFGHNPDTLINMSIDKLLAEKEWNLADKFLVDQDIYYRLNAYEMLNDDGSYLGKIYSFVDATHEYLYTKELEYLSFHDSLTKAYNKHFINANYKHYIREDKLPMGVIFCDINGMKAVNDTYGHDAGDQALIETVQLIKDVLTDEERIIRLGGDEFIVLCPNRDAQKLKEKVTAIETIIAQKSKFDLTIACGQAFYTSMEDDIRDIVAKADKQMYLNKQAYYGSNE